MCVDVFLGLAPHRRRLLSGFRHDVACCRLGTLVYKRLERIDRTAGPSHIHVSTRPMLAEPIEPKHQATDTALNSWPANCPSHHPRIKASHPYSSSAAGPDSG